MQRPEMDENEDRMTFRQVLENFLNGKYGQLIEYISTFLSVSSCTVYLVTTYTSNYTWFQDLNMAIEIFYLLEYVLRFFASQHRIQYIISVEAIIDLITILPLFFVPLDPGPELIGDGLYIASDVSIFQSVTVIFRSLRLTRIVNKIFKIGETEVSQQIFKIFLTILTLLFVTAGVLEAFENPVRVDNYIAQIQLMTEFPCNQVVATVKPTTFHEMFYFVVVTLATVGYGDVVPVSELGRIVVIVLIILALVLIPKQTNELIRLISMQSVYARAIYKTNSEVPHILICGHLSVAALRDFCNELFHPDHGSQDKNAVIMQAIDPSVEMESFTHNPEYEFFLTYLKGNPMIDRDLKRAKASSAKACILLTNKYGSDSFSADHKNILTALAIKKYVYYHTNENMRLCMQLIKPESKTHYYSSLTMKSNDQLIVVEEFKMNLVAKSCFVPGIISMISNLIISAGDVSDEEFDEEWIKEYTSGMGHEIYRTDLSFKFQGKKFSEVAAIVYNEFNGIVFGLELDIGNQTIIRLNPGSYVIPNTAENHVKVYLICEDKEVADQVATYEMTAEEASIYHQYQTQRTIKKGEKRGQRLVENVGDIPFNDDDDDSTTISNQDLMGSNDEENELLGGDYVLLSEPINLMNATRITIQDDPEITRHIVVCGIHPSIYYFLLPLRANYLKELQYIVILSPEPPSIEIWERISQFPKIVYIKGSPLLTEDLIRANINAADKAVVLGHDISSDKKIAQENDQMIDAESIFIYKAIKKCNKNVQIMIELVYASNIEFLLPKEVRKEREQDEDLKYDLTTLFAAGEVYISAIIDTLTCQSYYNQHIVTILQQLLTGGKQSNPVIRAICEHAELKQSNLWQIPVPEDFLNKTFGELFNYLAVERDLIPLGLYRLPGASDNSNPYVFTNPQEDVKLTHRDKVFVLAYSMPNDLLSGNIETKEDRRGDRFIGGVGGGLTGAGANSGIGLTSSGQANPNISHGSFENNMDSRNRSEFDSKKLLKPERNNPKKDNQKYRLEVPVAISKASNEKKLLGNKPIGVTVDIDNVHPNSATYLVLEQVNQHIHNMHNEINQIKNSIAAQDEQIVEKIKNALRQEIANLGN